MSATELEPGIYRGQAAGCFGLFRLKPNGQWLFSVPVAASTWHVTRLDPDDTHLLVPIALDSESGGKR